MQEILVYLIVLGATGYLVKTYFLPKRLFSKSKTNSEKGCTNSNCGCG